MSRIYVKKPVRVQAFRYGFEEIPEWMYGKTWIEHKSPNPPEKWLIIHTLEGDMRGDEGDFIIKGIKGEIYPCKSDIFEKSYEPLE